MWEHMNTLKPQPFQQQQQQQNQTQQYPAGSVVPLYFYNPWISPWPIYPIHPSQLVYNNNNTPIQGTSTLPGPGIEAGEKIKKEGSKTQSLIPKAKKPIWLQQESSSSRNSGASISTSDDERDRFNISLPRGSVYMNIVHEVDSEYDDEDNGRFDSEAAIIMEQLEQSIKLQSNTATNRWSKKKGDDGRGGLAVSTGTGKRRASTAQSTTAATATELSSV
ncbi:hypothetical protein BDR26DRAFT_920799 [Obelidium mucronatum]|nr:hypothetical protein BDR26DRAFT_920799 [Obelidium mucronatum]